MNLPLTSIKALHVTQLRAAVNGVRRLAEAAWAEPVTPGATVKATHVAELRRVGRS